MLFGNEVPASPNYLYVCIDRFFSFMIQGQLMSCAPVEDFEVIEL